MYRITFFILGFMVITLGFTVQSQQRSFVVERAGVPCGTVLLHVDHLRNGYVEYEVREECAFIGIDDKEIKHIRSLKFLADSSLRVISLDGFELLGSRRYQIEGSCMRGTLHLSRIGNDGETHRWREDCAVLPDIMLPELLRKPWNPLPENVFALRDLKTVPVSVKMEALADGRRRITVDDTQIYVLYPDGMLQSWEHIDHRVLWREADGSERGRHCDLDLGVYWDAGQALLPTSEDNIRGLDVALSGLPEEGMHGRVVDNRQQTIPDTALEDGALHIRTGYTDHYFTECPLPVDNPDLEQYLQDSPLLNLSSEALKNRAAALRNWDRNGANVAKAILRWCEVSFSFDPHMPLLAADQLLRDSRGTSLHAAQLFVALARRAAVPARFVLGVRPVQGRWRSTVWAEVWTMEWVAVRPLDGRILREAQYIRLGDAATVAGLQMLAARMRDVLRIDVLNVLPADTTAGGALRTGIVNREYSNRSYRCSVTAPEGWIIEERLLGEETVLTMVPELGSAVRFEMHLFDNPYFKHTLEIYNTRRRTLTGILKEAEIEQEGEMTFSGRKVPFMLYTYLESSADAAEQRVRTADCIVGIGNRGYVFRFTAPDETWDQYSGHLETILQSVRLLLR